VDAEEDDTLRSNHTSSSSNPMFDADEEAGASVQAELTAELALNTSHKAQIEALTREVGELKSKRV